MARFPAHVKPNCPPASVQVVGKLTCFLVLSVLPSHIKRVVMSLPRFAIAIFGCLLLALSTSIAEDTKATAAPANQLTAAEQTAGWKLLFDGKTTEGWRGYNKKDASGWVVKEGALYLEKPCSGDLITAEKFGDFELSLDWKFETGNNSGVIYRALETKGPSYITGPELQVTPQKASDKLGKNAGGSLYDLYAPTENAFQDGQEWVTYKVVAKGKHIEHWVNGKKVVDCDIGSDDWNTRYNGSKWAKAKEFAAAAEGHLCLQDHGAKILFRNVKIRVLK